MSTLLKFILLSFLFVSCASINNQNFERIPASFQSCLTSFNKIINYKPVENSKSIQLFDSPTLSALEVTYGAESLLEIQRRFSQEEIRKNNKLINALFLKELKLKPIKDKKEKITREEASNIYVAMRDSKVNKKNDCYDPTGKVGFCFGRATITHLEALLRNVHPDAIRKIWIVGDMQQWGHHVATMIYTDEGWLVIDSELAKPELVKDWLDFFIKTYKAKDAKEIMTFTTQAGRFSPYDTETYNAINLFNTHSEEFDRVNDYYRGYFHDYFNDLDNVMRPSLVPTLVPKK